MASFFQKARDRAQEAAAQFQQTVSSSGSQGDVNAAQRGSFTYTGSLPHVFRHGMASIDPRYEYNRSFHQLSGRIKSTRIDHEALARETKGMAAATYRWGQDQLAEKREDSAGDEALADVSDRLAYMLSLVGDLHVDHAKRVEESRADLKRIQKLESELAPRRQQRIKIHKELMALMPERAMAHSDKIVPLEESLKALENEDKEKEQELGKLKREALRSSFDAQFDSLIELGEKMAVVSRYGKLLLEQLPVYAPPFPSPRSHARLPEEAAWQNEAQVAAIRAAVAPALGSFKPNLSLPNVPTVTDASSLSRRDTVRFAESNKKELADSLHEDQTHPAELTADADLHRHPSRQSLSSGPLSPLPEGGSLPPNLNLEPTVLPQRRPTLNAGDQPSPPVLPPRSPMHEDAPGMSVSLDSAHDGSNAHNATIADAGPTFAETGSPISSTDPGPKTGVLSPRKSHPAILKPMPPLPSDMAAASSPPGNLSATRPAAVSPFDVTGTTAAASATEPSVASTSVLSKEEEARQERLAKEQREVQALAVAARLRRDGSIVRRGDPDWERAETEELPPYHE